MTIKVIMSLFLKVKAVLFVRLICILSLHHYNCWLLLFFIHVCMWSKGRIGKSLALVVFKC